MNNGSFVYTALQLHPTLAFPSDHSQAWSFERRDGYTITLRRLTYGAYRWNVCWLVDGVPFDLDVDPCDVIAVSVGPLEQLYNEHSCRTEGGAGAA